jgi:methionyl aminopeptidase
MNQKDKEDILLAGQITRQVREEIKDIVKKDQSMLQLAESIESRIIELGGKPAFPVNLSINEIAAHHTPSPQDQELTHGLLKIDFGVSINGWSSDNSISIDLENSEKNRQLIKAAETALNNVLNSISKNSSFGEIGKSVQETMHEHSCQPIVNLSGHSIMQYELHAGKSIPNFDTKDPSKIGKGLFAIEPFSTTQNSSGKIKDGNPSGIYSLRQKKPVRNPEARKILEYIEDNYQTLPFCTRWIAKKFPVYKIPLSQLEQAGILHQYKELVESTKAIIAQAERTILIEDDQIIVIN